MPFRSKLIRAETQIAAFLGEAPHRIYSKLELREIFYKARRHDLLARHTTLLISWFSVATYFPSH
jgi:hypothetical protein